MITMDHDDERTRSFFGEDRMHLTQEGHAMVAQQLLTLVETWDWPAAAPMTNSSAAARMPVTCHLGDELGALVHPSVGFSRANFARDPTTREDKVSTVHGTWPKPCLPLNRG